MYFWKIDKLKEQIRNNELSEKDKLSYLILQGLFFLGLYELVAYLEIEKNLWYFLDLSNQIVIFIIGTITAYRYNGGNDGKGFLGKFLSVGFVFGVRFLVYGVITVLILIMQDIVVTFVLQKHNIFNEIIYSLVFAILYASYYYHVCTTIKELKS